MSSEHELLSEEYEHSPVPMSARRSTFSVSMIWLGAPMVITGAITGSILVLNMGFVRALAAIILGNLLMLVYTGALAQNAVKTGNNSALQASAVFGRKGYAAVSALLSTLVLGWFAVQTGLTGALIHSAFDINYLAITIAAGALYLLITFLGVKGLHWIGVISVPLFVLVAGGVLVDSLANAGWEKVMAFQGSDPASQMAFGVGLTVVLALFADGATLTADFSRWAPTKRGAWISTFCAFPLAMTVALLSGGIMTAALQTANANPFGMDNMFGYMVGAQSPILSTFAIVFLLCNLGSICSHCLYFAAVGYSRMTKSSMRTCAIVLGVIGTAAAAANVWALFIPWLSFLGIVVPPLGAILILDLLFLRVGAKVDSEWRVQPFAAWAVGSAVAFLVEFWMPTLSTAVAAFSAGGIAYAAIQAKRSQSSAAQAA